MSTLPTLSQLLAAQQQEEGGIKAAGYALNNPFDLEDSSGNLESFSSLGEGQQAGQNYFQNASSGTNQNYWPGMTLGEFETTYTGGDPYASGNIGTILGVDPTTTSLQSIVNNADLGGGTPSLQQQLQDSAYQEPTLPGGYGVNVSPTGLVTETGMGQTKTAQAPSTNNWITQIENYLASKSLDWVAVVVGIVLIAGAVFGFHELTTTVIQGAKKGAAIAAA